MELSLIKTVEKRRLYILYALNIADWICTELLVRTGRFYEANPLMRLFIGSIPAGFAVKVVLPALIIAAILRLMKRLNDREAQLVGSITCAVTALYIALCVNHIINFISLLSG